MRHGAVGACGPGLCLLPIALLHGPTPPSPSTMNTLPELLALEKIIELGAPHLQVQVVRQVQLARGGCGGGGGGGGRAGAGGGPPLFGRGWSGGGGGPPRCTASCSRCA